MPSEDVLPSAATIKELFGTWNQALQTGDPTVVADLYAPDAVLLPTVHAAIHDTREKILAYFTAFLAKGPSGHLTDSRTRVLGPDATCHSGLYRFTFARPGENAAQVEARFTFVYRRADGMWRIVEHHSSVLPG
ncbi:MAG: SgcJ/EcaC family oxidoreductase [Sporichthyaceae bacterium]